MWMRLELICGLGPEQMLPILDEIMEITSLPVIVKPNAGASETAWRRSLL